MIKIKDTNHFASLQLLIFIAAVVLFYLLLKPLLNVFLASIILAYVFYPLYLRIKKSFKNESLSIFLTLFLIIIIFLLPFVFVASQIPKQASYISDYSKENIINKGFFDFSCNNIQSVKCNAVNFVTGSGFLDLDKIIDGTLRKITQAATFVVTKIPNFIVSIALALFISFFLFKDGKKLVTYIVKMVPLNKKHSNKLIEKFGKVTYSVVYAHIIVAIAQGALGAVGFYIFGIKGAIFWGVVMAIFALIPLIGPAIIWIPASLLLILNGIIINSYWDMGKGVGLLIYGIFIISTIDNILRIKLVGSGSDVHPLTVLIGIIGGINLFGLIGIFIGPIALSLLITFFKDFRENYA